MPKLRFQVSVDEFDRPRMRFTSLLGPFALPELGV
jgi:hypothetical protein